MPDLQPSVQIYGLKEMEAALKKIHQELHGKEGRPVNNALRAVQKQVEGRAKDAALKIQSEHGTPIDWYKTKNGKWAYKGKELAPPGRLSRAIIRKTERRPRYAAVYYVGVNRGDSRNDPAGAWYAPFIEFKGGKGGRGKNFLRNSIQPEADGRLYAKHLATGIQRLAKKIGDENLRQVASKVRKAHTL